MRPSTIGPTGRDMSLIQLQPLKDEVSQRPPTSAAGWLGWENPPMRHRHVCTESHCASSKRIFRRWWARRITEVSALRHPNASGRFVAARAVFLFSLERMQRCPRQDSNFLWSNANPAIVHLTPNFLAYLSGTRPEEGAFLLSSSLGKLRCGARGVRPRPIQSDEMSIPRASE